MKITQNRMDQVMTLKLEGRLDVNSSPVFQEQFMKLVEESNDKVLLDLSELEFIASSGLRTMILGGKRALELRKGKIALCAVRPEVMEVIEMLGFAGYFEIFPTHEEAIAALK